MVKIKKNKNKKVEINEEINNADITGRNEVFEDTVSEAMEFLNTPSISGNLIADKRLADDSTVVHDAPPMLKIEHLKKRYPNSEVYSVKDLSFE